MQDGAQQPIACHFGGCNRLKPDVLLVPSVCTVSCRLTCSNCGAWAVQAGEMLRRAAAERAQAEAGGLAGLRRTAVPVLHACTQQPYFCKMELEADALSSIRAAITVERCRRRAGGGPAD
jgi:hypothetical protein